eukprot:4461022-Lingulodinium_polyedra.AAC.1
MCHAGICQAHGTLIGLAGRDADTRDRHWQGSSLSFCAWTAECGDRQAQLLRFWENKTGEALSSQPPASGP